MGKPCFEDSDELPDSLAVGVPRERAALPCGSDAAPLLIVCAVGFVANGPSLTKHPELNRMDSGAAR